MKAVRTGVREWICTNDRGGVVKVADAKEADAFSPGELLQLAAATCAGLSIDHRLTHDLGEDIFVTLEVEPDRVPEENRYSGIRTRVRLDLSSLDETQLEGLKRRVQDAIDRACTVGRTLAAGAEATTVLDNTGENS